MTTTPSTTPTPAIGPRHRADGEPSRLRSMPRHARIAPGAFVPRAARHRSPGRADLVRVDGAATRPLPIRIMPTEVIPAVSVVPFGIAAEV